MEQAERDLFRRIFTDNEEKFRLEDGLINTGKPGHTRDGSAVAEAHCGPTTANFYVGMTLAGLLQPQVGDQMLDALAALQITEADHPHTSGFYWYREERDFHDSNAAFFILAPLMILLLKRESVVDAGQVQRLDQLLAGACGWFRQEIRQPKLYYPNKILSDGALLLAIARRCGDEAAYAEGVQFFHTWLIYTANRGWGWGENLSLSYIRICLNALRMASLSLGDAERELRSELEGVIRYLLDIVRFHGGSEFVPTIRSYNFSGQETPHSLLWWLAGVKDDPESMRDEISQFAEALTLLLFEQEANATQRAAMFVPRVRKERIFDQVKAYSWIGHTARLGSVGRFPVIAGSYQWPTWGLGWQSMPVAALVNGQQMAYLRLYVHDGERLRTHPAYNTAEAYLASALFKESPLPAIHQRAAQSEGCLLAVRSISGLRHQAKEIADEWLVHRFTGEIATASDASGRPWTLLVYPDTIVMLAAVATRGLDGKVTEDFVLQISYTTQADGSQSLALRQSLYAGELTQVHAERIEAGWAIVVLDQTTDIDEAKTWLRTHRVEVAAQWDSEIPRESAHLERRVVRLVQGEQAVVALTVDPYEDGQIP